ncbi:MAG: peptidylprolyl isomerase [Elusimicrobiota bacterium]|nr:peptidylprolyl isomerase [Elusimicrobiota bacterium]
MKKIFFVLILVAGCGDGYVARVGSDKITADSFKNRMLDVPTYYRGFLETEGGRRQYLEGIVNEGVLVELAKAKGIHRRPEVRGRIKALEDQILLEQVVEELKKGPLNVEEEEISDYYEKNRDFYLHPPRVRVSHILLSSKDEAVNMLAQIKDGKSFSKLASEYSIDRNTAKKGGDLNYFERGDMVPEFEEVAFKLQNTGDISKPVKTPFGWHIIKLTGRSTAVSKNKDEAKDEIVQFLSKQKLDELLKFYKKKFHVKVNYDRLSRIYPPWYIPEGTAQEDKDK